LLYGGAYRQLLMMSAMNEQGSEQAQGAAPNAKPNPKDQEAPITGEENVQTQ
jgi:hypothetical protein